MVAFYRDLKALGIPKVDERGFHVHLHSLRHSCGTRLASADVPLAAAMTLMRHSDPRLTAKIYADSSLLPLSSSIAKIPGMQGKNISPVPSPETGFSGLNESQAVLLSETVATSQVGVIELLSRALS